MFLFIFRILEIANHQGNNNTIENENVGMNLMNGTDVRVCVGMSLMSGKDVRECVGMNLMNGKYVSIERLMHSIK